MQRACRGFIDGSLHRGDGDPAPRAFNPVRLARLRLCSLARRPGVGTDTFRFGLGQLDGPPADVKSAPRVTAYGSDLATRELDGVGLDDVARHTLEPRLDDLHKLLVVVPRKRNARKPEATADLVAEGPLGQVHSVGYRQHDQPGVPQAGPVEEVVHDALVFRDELVELVHQNDAGHTAGAGVVEFALEQV